MVLLSGGGSNMYSCRILYIGSAKADERADGVESMQGPLNQRYPSDLTSVEGIDANVSVLQDRLVVQYVESGEAVEFPLDRLKICAAVREVDVVDSASGENRRRFIPVNQINCDKDHPAIFAAIIRKSQGHEHQECHMFICNSARDALHLVNTTATANMAMKQGPQGRQGADRSIVVQNGYNGNVSRNEAYSSSRAQTAPESNTIYIRHTGDVSSRSEQQHVSANLSAEPLPPNRFQLRQPEATDNTEVIYIGFDKTNLLKKDDEGYEVKMGSRVDGYQSSRMAYADMPPSPRVARSMVVQGPPRVVRGPPQPMMYGPPPGPASVMYARGPPPPPQARMYERRVMTPPGHMMMQQPQVRTRYRARSSSPIRYASSDVRMTEKYQPRWRSHTSEFGGPVPKNYNYHQTRPMFLNERAFSQRVNGDSRMSRMGYYGGYQTGHSTLYDRPVTKSNPKYSSSDNSSDDGRDLRYDRSRR